jgi:hypothetical protein
LGGIILAKIASFCSFGYGLIIFLVIFFPPHIYSSIPKVLCDIYPNTGGVGVECVAVSYELLELCATHRLTQITLEGFKRDWESTYGKEKNCLIYKNIFVIVWLSPKKPIFKNIHAQMTIYCVLIKIVSTIFGANLSLKPFWVLIIVLIPL